MDYLTHAQTALLKFILPVLHLSTGFELVPQADMQNLFNLTYTQPVSLQISLLAGSRTNKQIKKKHSAAICFILFGKIWSKADKKSRSCSTH